MPGWVLGVAVGVSSVAVAVGTAERVEAVEFEDGWVLPASEVSGALLGEVAARAGQGQVPGWPDRLVLAVPAAWGPERTGALRAAAAEAGLPEPALVIGPVAAAWHFAASTGQGRLVAVVDVDANGASVALLRRAGGGFELVGQPGNVVVRSAQEPADVAWQAAAEFAALIAEAGVSARDLASLYVTGPASRDLAVTQAITETLGIQARSGPGPATATACGAVELVMAEGQPRAPRPLRRGHLLPVSKGAFWIGACGLITAAVALLVLVFLVPHRAVGTRADSTTTPTSASGTGKPSPAAPALPPGVYQVARAFEAQGGWVTTVDSVQVAKNGQTVFIVTSKNTTGTEGVLSCGGGECVSPMQGSITLPNKTVINSVTAYCPKYPEVNNIILPPHGEIQTYVVFASPQGLNQRFTFYMYGPGGLGGTLSGLTISR